MGRIGKPRLLIALLVLTLVLIGVPSAAFGQQAPAPAESSGQRERDDLRTYHGSGVTTREDRTAITRAGAAIKEIGDDYVTVTATPERYEKSPGKGLPSKSL